MQNRALENQTLSERALSLLQVNSQGESRLMLAQTENEVKDVLREAANENCLVELVNIRNHHGHSIYTYNAPQFQNLENIIEDEVLFLAIHKDLHEKLILLTIPHDHRKLTDILHIARKHYFDAIGKCYYRLSEVEEVIGKYRKLSRQHLIAPNFSEHAQKTDSYSVLNTHNYLYGHDKFSQEVTSKEEAVKSAIADCCTLLANAKSCIPYLQFLNNEFSRYYREKNGKYFPMVPRDQYDYEIIDHTYYPIPKSNFVPIKKFHALQEFLFCLLKQNGLASNAYKWIGFIPHDIADKIVANGDFFTEDRLGPGLFHNKISHMIQLAIYIYAIQAGQIKTTYLINGSPIQIQMKDILAGLVSLKSQKNRSLWTESNDSRYISTITFIDPYRLASIIMVNGNHFGLIELSNALIFSFCQGYKNFFETLRNKDNQLSNLIPQELNRMLNDLESTNFQAPKSLIKHSIFHAKQSGKVVKTDDKNFAVAQKNYQPIAFEPKRFV